MSAALGHICHNDGHHIRSHRASSRMDLSLDDEGYILTNCLLPSAFLTHHAFVNMSTLSGWLGPYSANKKSMEESETGKRKENAKEENTASTVAV